MTRIVRWLNLPQVIAAFLAFGLITDLILVGRECGLSKSDWAAWVQAVGSIIAIAIAIWVPYKQKQDAAAADVKDRHEEARRVCLAIRDELTMLQRLFTDGPNVSALLAIPPGEIFNRVLPSVDPIERFPIYGAVIGRLTMIDDDQLRQDIISAYEWATGLIHAGMQNNRMLAELSEAAAKRDVRQYDLRLTQLKESAAGMKHICKQTIERVTALLPALDRAAGRA
jgi:hypothetical protein